MHFTYLQIFLTVSLPIMGLAYALVGGIKLPLVDRLRLDEGKVGRLVGGFGTMFGPTILLCGFLTDALGRMGIWLAGSGAVALAIFIFARTATFRGALVAVLLLGVGWAAQVNVSNVLMRVAVPPDRSKEFELYNRLKAIDPTSKDEKELATRSQLRQELRRTVKEESRKLVWATNFFDFVFGFGALVTPLILGVTLRNFGYQKALAMIAVLAAVPVVLGAFAEMNPPPPPQPVPVEAYDEVKQAAPAMKSGAGGMLASPLFWVIGFAFLFYVPLETSVSGWATTLVLRQTPKDVPEDKAKKVAGMALSGYWFGFTGGRLLVSILGTAGVLTRVLGEGNEQTLLLIMAIACLVLMLAIACLRGRFPAIAAVILSGLACGPVFPTMMAVVLLSVPPDTMGRAVGIFFFFASVGWTVIPGLIGAVARRTGNIQKGFLVATASAAVFLSFVVARGLMMR